MAHFVGDSCKGGHWMERRAKHWTDAEYREASGAFLKYQCGFCKNGVGPSGVIGLVGRKPWTYICLTCITDRVLGEEFFKWVHQLPGSQAGLMVTLEKPMKRFEMVGSSPSRTRT